MLQTLKHALSVWGSNCRGIAAGPTPPCQFKLCHSLSLSQCSLPFFVLSHTGFRCGSGTITRNPGSRLSVWGRGNRIQHRGKQVFLQENWQNRRVWWGRSGGKISDFPRLLDPPLITRARHPRTSEWCLPTVSSLSMSSGAIRQMGRCCSRARE